MLQNNLFLNIRDEKCGKNNLKSNIFHLIFSDAVITGEWEKFWWKGQELAHLPKLFSFLNDTCIRKIMCKINLPPDYPYHNFHLD